MTSRVRLFDGILDAYVSGVLDEKIDTAMSAGIESAKRLVPVDTGALRDDIGVIHREEGSGSYGVTLDYGPTVEFGDAGRNQPEQPYLRPSIDAMKKALGG